VSGDAERAIGVDLGKLYADCYVKKTFQSRGREQNVTIDRMVEAVAAVRKAGYEVEFKLGNLVGELTRDSPFMFKGGELRVAIIKMLNALRRL